MIVVDFSFPESAVPVILEPDQVRKLNPVALAVGDARPIPYFCNGFAKERSFEMFMSLT